jgi:protein disulfide-isomerase A1
VTIDATEYYQMAAGLGLKDRIFPALAVQNPMLGQSFPFDQRGVITPEAVEGFVLDIVQGRVQPGSRSEKDGGTAHTDL